MHWLRQHVGAKGELPPYADIAPSILRSHPPNPDVLPYVYKFMSRFGEASMMKNTESFVAAFGSVKNQLSGMHCHWTPSTRMRIWFFGARRC